MVLTVQEACEADEQNMGTAECPTDFRPLERVAWFVYKHDTFLMQSASDMRLVRICEERKGDGRVWEEIVGYTAVQDGE